MIMKNKALLFLSILMILLFTACSNNTKVYSLDNITQRFEDAELHLKPQADDNYPEILNVKPSVYELLDDSLYIYVYESEEQRIEASKELNVEQLFNAPSYVYQTGNVLLIYISLSAPEDNYNKQIEDIVHARYTT